MSISRADLDTLSEFAERLRQVRQLRGLTTAAAVSLVDGEIAQTSINRFERGARVPELRSLIALCRAYDMDVLVKRDGTIEVRGTGLRPEEGVAS